jgi:hypothetical protein
MSDVTEKMGQKKGEIQKKMSPERQRLLDVLLDEEHMQKDVRTKCKIAKVDHNTYYRAVKDPDFLEAMKAGSLEMCGKHLPEIFKAMLSNAKNETVAGHQDRKLLATMLGLNSMEGAGQGEFSVAALLKEIIGGTTPKAAEPSKIENGGKQPNSENDPKCFPDKNAIEGLETQFNEDVINIEVKH